MTTWRSIVLVSVSAPAVSSFTQHLFPFWLWRQPLLSPTLICMKTEKVPGATMKSRKEHIGRPPQPPPDFDRPSSWYNRYVPVVGSRLRISCHVDDFDAEDVRCGGSSTTDSSCDTRSVSSVESSIGALHRPLGESDKPMLADVADWRTHDMFGKEDSDDWWVVTDGGQEDSQLSAVLSRQCENRERTSPLHHQSIDRKKEAGLASTGVLQCIDDAEADQLKSLLPGKLSPHSEFELDPVYAHQSLMHGDQIEQTVDPKQLTNIAGKCISMETDIKPNAHPAAHATSFPQRGTLESIQPAEPALRHYSRYPSYIAVPDNIGSRTTRSNSSAGPKVVTRAKPATISKIQSLMKRRTDRSSTPPPATPSHKRRSAGRSIPED
nr:hypothetical protein CFP56_24496 [Quercus suber]